jgi:hypothetical protein
MLMCNRVTLKTADAFSDRPATVAVLPQRLGAAFIIKNVNAALVWPVCGQSERK